MILRRSDVQLLSTSSYIDWNFLVLIFPDPSTLPLNPLSTASVINRPWLSSQQAHLLTSPTSHHWPDPLESPELLTINIHLDHLATNWHSPFNYQPMLTFLRNVLLTLSTRPWKTECCSTQNMRQMEFKNNFFSLEHHLSFMETYFDV